MNSDDLLNRILEINRLMFRFALLSFFSLLFACFFLFLPAYVSIGIGLFVSFRWLSLLWQLLRVMRIKYDTKTK